MVYGQSMLALERQTDLLREADLLRAGRAAADGRRPAGRLAQPRVNRWSASRRLRALMADAQLGPARELELRDFLPGH